MAPDTEKATVPMISRTKEIYADTKTTSKAICQRKNKIDLRSVFLPERFSRLRCTVLSLYPCGIASSVVCLLHFPEVCPETVLLPESFAPSAASCMRSPVSFIQMGQVYHICGKPVNEFTVLYKFSCINSYLLYHAFIRGDLFVRKLPASSTETSHFPGGHLSAALKTAQLWS